MAGRPRSAPPPRGAWEPEAAAAAAPGRGAPEEAAPAWQRRLFGAQLGAKVFGFVGGSEWLFAARVSRRFREECLRAGGPRTDRRASLLSLPRAVQTVVEAPYLLRPQGDEGRAHGELMSRFTFDDGAVRQLWVLALAGGSALVLSFLESSGIWSADKELQCRSFDSATSFHLEDVSQLCSCAIAAFYGQCDVIPWLKSRDYPNGSPDLCLSAAVAGARPQTVKFLMSRRQDERGPVRPKGWAVPAMIFIMGQAAQAGSLRASRVKDACEALSMALTIQPGLLRSPSIWVQRSRNETGSLSMQLQRGLEMAAASEAAAPLVLALLRAAIDPKTGGGGLAKDLLGHVSVQAARARHCALLEQVTALPAPPGFVEDHGARLWRDWRGSRAGFAQLQARYYCSERSAPRAQLQREDADRHVLVYLVTKSLEASAAGIREEVWSWLSSRALAKDEHAASVQINMGDWESGWQMAKAGWPVSKQTVRDRLLPHIAAQRGRVDVFKWAASQGALLEADGLGLVESALECPAVLDYLLGAEAAEAGLWGAGIPGPTQQQWDRFWRAPRQCSGEVKLKLKVWLLSLGLDFEASTGLGGRLEAMEAIESLRRAGRDAEALGLAERQGLCLRSLSTCLRPWEAGPAGDRCAAAGGRAGAAPGAAPAGREAPAAGAGPLQGPRPRPRADSARPWRHCEAADCAACQHGMTFVAAFRAAAWLYHVEQQGRRGGP